MQDELWMRNWNDAQPRFSADVDRGAARLAALVRRIAARMMLPETARQTGPAAR